MIPKQDRIKPRTVEDLERKYNFNRLKEKLDELLGDWSIGNPYEISHLYNGSAIYSSGSVKDGVESKVFLTPERVYVTKRTSEKTTVDSASWADIIRVVNAAK